MEPYIFIIIVAAPTLAFVLANYSYQLFHERNWRLAHQRSWFQGSLGALILISGLIITKYASNGTLRSDFKISWKDVNESAEKVTPRKVIKGSPIILEDQRQFMVEGISIGSQDPNGPIPITLSTRPIFTNTSR